MEKQLLLRVKKLEQLVVDLYKKLKDGIVNSLTTDEIDAIKVSNVPNAGNPFATTGDLNDAIANIPVVDSRPYKVYSALITQSGASAPTVSMIIENTLGATISFSKNSVGSYKVTASSSVFNTSWADSIYINLNALGSTIFQNLSATTKDFQTADKTGTIKDDLLFNSRIDIYVYNNVPF